LQDARHAGVQLLVRDLNLLYRGQTALHRLDSDGRGFEWITADERQASVFAWLRRDAEGRMVIVVSNMTPVPRPGFVLGVPEGAAGWLEILNTDSSHYGGSNVGNGGGPLPVQAQAAHGRAQSISVTLPPLATIFLAPC
jgi:1,4-alpha-glucan branching enzyme